MRKYEEPILVARSSLPSLDEYAKMLEPIWDSAWLTNMGIYHEQFKEELKSYLKVAQLELFVNGHMALELAIQSMGLTGEVITTPYSFASTTHAIVRNGLTPVFCDINPYDYTIDVNKLESLITERTSAIVPVHVYGNLCDVERIQEIADRHHLKVIYDAAHSFGEELDHIGVGDFGDVSMFSFHATKVFHSIEGGAVVYRDSGMKDILYQLKNFGITGYESVEQIGVNGKMNEFQAAMGLCNLRYVDSGIAKRMAVTKRYREHLGDVEGIRLMKENPRVKYNYAYMPVVFDGYKANRDQVYDMLKTYNIIPRKYFYPCINAYECYKDRFCEDDTPVAKQISRQVLTLPLYADLPMEAVDNICEVIKSFE